MKKSWKKVSIGGTVAMMVGTASAGSYVYLKDQAPASADGDDNDEILVSEEISASDTADASTNETADDILDTQEYTATLSTQSVGDEGTDRYVPESIPEAHGVSDSMSFSQAFAAARAEVGPGGVFQWHGNVYGTYYAEEWDNMSHAEHNQFYARVQDQIEVHHNGGGSNGGGYEDPEITVISTEEVEIDGETVTATHLNIGGTAAVFIDVDQDGEYDVALVDADGNGELSEDEVMDISDAGIEVLYPEGEDFATTHDDGTPDPDNGTGMATDDLAQDMPDYVNDADFLA